MSYLIKELPNNEKPREKFKNTSIENMNDADLLAIILRTGTNHVSVKDLALKILIDFDGLENLNQSSLESLSKIKGIGEVKAITLLASLELGKRASKTHFKQNLKIHSAEIIVNMLKEEVSVYDQEHFIAIFLNSKNEIIKQKTIFIGSANRSIVHPRDIFKEAIKNSAVKMLVVHNHPSGDSFPSKEDIIFTKNLFHAGDLLQIPLLDHIIIGKNEYYSFYDHQMK